MYTINIKFEQPGLIPVILKNVQPGYTLLEIALDNGIELRHDCGGICSCSTCHLYLERGGKFVREMNMREKHLINRAPGPKSVSRLGCQCLLKEDQGEIEFTVPDQTREKFSNETI